MPTLLSVNPNDISPSQDFLKEKTVRFILECIRNGNEDQLPPMPIVRKDSGGKLVAIDGHNLLAVMSRLGRKQIVHVAENAADGLAQTSDANKARNQDLAEKYDSSLSASEEVAIGGIRSFDDLTARYPLIWEEIA